MQFHPNSNPVFKFQPVHQLNVTFFTRLLSVVLLSLLVACGGKKDDYADKMTEEHKDDAPVSNASSTLEPRLPVETEEVTYASVDGKEISGYLARAANPESNLPGVIVIHEWWGLNDNIRMMTRRLAGEGYKALAVDLYRGQVAETPQDARSYMSKVNQQNAVANLEQAYAYLTEQAGTEEVGVIGWCFGGGWSLQTAIAMPEKIDATVIYYGRLVTDKEKLSPLDMPILGIFGEEDQGIPPEDVRAFEEILQELNKPNSIHIYEGANHAFANPSGNRYQKEAAEDAWDKTVSFFNTHLK